MVRPSLGTLIFLQQLNSNELIIGVVYFVIIFASDLANVLAFLVSSLIYADRVVLMFIPTSSLLVIS